MRRYWVVALAVLTLLGVLSPPAFAQAPTPVVTISGLLQHHTTTGVNIYDGNFTRSGDKEWNGALRARPDITAQVGNVKMVLGFEFDLSYGQVGTADTSVTGAGGTVGGVQTSGMTGGFDLNTDVLGVIELKWAYTEFPFTGAGSLLPFVPIPTVARVGAQPFATTYKGAVLASGDFAGLNFVTTWTPQIKSHLAIAQLEEQGQGIQTANHVSAVGRCHNDGVGFAAGAACRGDDWAMILGVEVTPMKGLDIRPIYSFFNGFATTIARAGALPASTNLVDEERRHTIGFDSRWSWGNLFIDPTYFYQFGSREIRCAAPANFVGAAPAGCIVGVRSDGATAKISAHFFDIRGGYRMGPLLLEAMVGFSSGNKGRDNLAKEIRSYAPIDTDTGYYATWASILALNVDSTHVGAVNGLGATIGYLQYGRVQTGYRATYSWTPALDTSVSISPTWTARAVDTDTPATTRAKGCIGNGLSGIPCNFEGDSSYIGTEANLGLVWRFAPNTRFDLVGAWLFAGGALDGAELAPGTPTGTTGVRRDASDAWLISSKLTFNY
ncbi:MAG: hypothetical protein WAP47_00090 [Candidatus Rokuibacteriota bacterium]